MFHIPKKKGSIYLVIFKDIDFKHPYTAQLINDIKKH